MWLPSSSTSIFRVFGGFVRPKGTRSLEVDVLSRHSWEHGPNEAPWPKTSWAAAALPAATERKCDYACHPACSLLGICFKRFLYIFWVFWKYEVWFLALKKPLLFELSQVLHRHLATALEISWSLHRGVRGSLGGVELRRRSFEAPRRSMKRSAKKAAEKNSGFFKWWRVMVWTWSDFSVFYGFSDLKRERQEPGGFQKYRLALKTAWRKKVCLAGGSEVSVLAPFHKATVVLQPFLLMTGFLAKFTSLVYTILHLQELTWVDFFSGALFYGQATQWDRLQDELSESLKVWRAERRVDEAFPIP